jgi:chromosome segregation ATPase
MNAASKLGRAALALGLLARPAGAGSWTTSWTSDSEYRQFAYALVEPTEDDGGYSILAGLESDRDELKRQSGRIEGSFVWMRQGNKRYVIQDPALVKRAKDILEPEAEMNQNQGKIGELQGQLGETQGQLGEEQGRLGERQARLAERQAKLAELQARRNIDAATRDQIDRLKEEIDAEQESIGRAQSRLGTQQEKMGRDQSKLGVEQQRAGQHRSEVVARVRVQMRSLLADAIKRGAAPTR